MKTSEGMSVYRDVSASDSDFDERLASSKSAATKISRLLLTRRGNFPLTLPDGVDVEAGIISLI